MAKKAVSLAHEDIEPSLFVASESVLIATNKETIEASIARELRSFVASYSLTKSLRGWRTIECFLEHLCVRFVIGTCFDSCIDVNRSVSAGTRDVSDLGFQ